MDKRRIGIKIDIKLKNMALYIYNQDTNEIAVVIEGYVSNEQAEDKASEFNFDQDLFAWSYTKGVDLFETEDTEYFNFDDED